MTQLVSRLLALFVVLCTGLQAATALTPGTGRIEIQRGGKTVPVWYYVPPDAAADTPILFVMHGVNRNADDYRNSWLPHAEKYRVVLLAPEFSEKEFPGDEGYNLGGIVDARKRALPAEQWAFSFIEPIFDEVRTALGNRSEKYYLYGHSAGAQFVHRYLYYVPNARVANVVAANSGWYTLPDQKIDFPYGLRGARVSDQALKTMLQRPVVILLGTQDNDPNHKHLRRAAEAMKQGPHRLARGQFFFNAAQRKAAELKVPFGWKLATAPGIGHSDRGMAAFAIEWLFGQAPQASAAPAKAAAPAAAAPVKASAPVAAGLAPIVGREPSRVRVLFGGDTDYAESYQEQYARAGSVNIMAEKGYEYSIEHLGRLMQAADYRVINLETVLTNRREKIFSDKAYLHYGDPVKVPEMFGRYGPLSFSLANNHTLDFGVPGLIDTFDALDAAKIPFFGAGRNRDEAFRPLLQELKVGNDIITLAIFGGFEYRKNYDEKYEFYATGDRPGTVRVEAEAVGKAIAALRKSHRNVYSIYFGHWGDNYLWKHAAQTKYAQDLRKVGVDLVVGAGAHMMQELEHDGRGWVFHGLGNFLFNTRGRYLRNLAAPFSYALMTDFTLEGGKVQARHRIYPLLSDNQLTNYQPRYLTEPEFSAFAALLAAKSNWDEATRAAVKPGRDDIGPFLELSEPARR